MRKPAICICENKDADQLRGNREADQRLCFRYTDSTIPLLSKSEISSLLPSSIAVQPCLYQTWSKTPKTGFLRARLISEISNLFLISAGLSPSWSERQDKACDEAHNDSSVSDFLISTESEHEINVQLCL